jgi:hypothetical protein
MPLQHLQLLAVFQAHQIIGKDRFLHRHGGRGFFLHHRCLPPHAGQSAIDILYQRRKMIRRHRVVGDVGSNDLRGQPKNFHRHRLVGHAPILRFF